MDIPPWSIPVLLAVMLVATTVIERMSAGRIPNPWILLNVVVAVAVTAVTGAWSMLIGGLILFCLMFVLWRQGVAGGGLAKLSLAVGILLGAIPAAIGGAAAVVIALVLTRVLKTQIGTMPGGIVLLLVSAIGIGSQMLMQGQ